MLQFRKNPWFSLGIHIDHKAPYIEFHLPRVIIRVGRPQKPVYSKDLASDVWLLSYNRLPVDVVDHIRRIVKGDER